MSKPQNPQRWQHLIYAFLLLSLLLIGLQIWSAYTTSVIVGEAQHTAINASKDEVDRENARQELIGRRIENESKGVLENNLATTLGALAAALVTISGAILALRGYIDAR